MEQKPFDPSDAMLDLNMFFAHNSDKIKNSKMQGFGFFFDMEEDGSAGMGCFPTFINPETYDRFTDVLAVTCVNTKPLRDLMAVILGKYYAFTGMKKILEDENTDN